jgi:nucleotide-binding universal stress UspA family protein
MRIPVESTEEDESDPIIGFGVEVCARAAAVVEDVGMVVVGGAGRHGWWRFPSLAASLNRLD